MDGYVIYIQPPVNTGYAYIALKHSDSLVTLYGHISNSEVGRYDFVKKGEVFAQTG
jgi:murein DD-endopeptidase MepM/ murein hydrolase activator NlpD